jgi:transcriptional regulator with GAF, ATPase, and Fis domain
MSYIIKKLTTASELCLRALRDLAASVSGRKLLTGLTILLIVYILSVVWCSQETTDIGLRCAFDTEVQRIDPSRFDFALTSAGIPSIGDKILRVGGRKIELWSDLLHLLKRLDEPEEYPRVPVEPAASFETLENVPQRESVIVQRGIQELVRVEFSRAGEEEIRVAWAVVTKPTLELFLRSVLWLAAKLALLAVVVVALWKRPQDRPLFRFFVLCVVTIGAYMGGYYWIQIATERTLVIVFMACAVLLPVVSLHFYLVFPRPKVFIQKYPWRTLCALYCIPLVLLAAMLITYLVIVYAYRRLHDVSLVRLLSPLFVDEISLALAVAPVFFFGCVVSLGHSFVTSQVGSRERNQVKWILVGALLAALPVGYTIYLAVAETEQFSLGGAATPMFVASLCFTLAYGLSISRYGLLDVDKVLNWGIVSIGVSIAAGIGYSILVFVGTLLIGSHFGPYSPLRQAVWVSLTALLLLFVLELLRWRLRKMMDRRLHRDRYQLEKTLRRVSDTVEQGVDPPTLCRRLTHAVAELLNVEHAAVFLRQGDPPTYALVNHLGQTPVLAELSADMPLVHALLQSPLVRLRPQSGPAPEDSQRQLKLLGAEMALPLRHEGQLLAVLLVGSRVHGTYDVEELHLLTTFTQLAALALQSAQGLQTIDWLHRDLRDKVEKISEQQRRISMLQSQLLRTGIQTAASEALVADTSHEGTNGAVRSESPANEIVGSSVAVQQLLQTVRKVAASPSAVLIRGESGTGKELLALALHQQSPRAAGPFVQVHCAALSPSLLESELFGHVKGAFTGAHRDKTGRFEMANGGTLFLDEIGDINLDTQTKLLRVLQEMSFERVGSSESIQVDVRIVAATNQDLERMMREGKFREDLFYRLNVITVRTPPLRERREDIYELALHFLRVYSQRSGKAITQIDEETLETLKAHDWPGNVRELENVIERAVALVEGQAITIRELPDELLHASRSNQDEAFPTTRLSHPATGFITPEADWSAQQDQQERERLIRALTVAGGNKARAARALGMPRSTLLSKLEKHGLAGKLATGRD